MAVRITAVVPGSPAARAGICAGWQLEAINQNEIEDVLDYQFYSTEKKLKVDLQDEAGKKRRMTVRKGEYEDLGLEFASYLMDRQHHCKNKCIFCFVDQMPPGMRETLYFKDDDARLSFLFGNYITLTNLRQKDIDRMIKMHISPVNVSVHTMDPALRQRLMGNPAAGVSRDQDQHAAGVVPGNQRRRTVGPFLTRIGESLPQCGKHCGGPGGTDQIPGGSVPAASLHPRGGAGGDRDHP